MTDRERKGLCYSEQSFIIRPEHMNSQGRLFGGQLMLWIDEIAGICARRYCRSNITTACVDKLDFKGAAHFNDTLVLTAEITYVGHTSLEVTVNTYSEKLDGTSTLINTAYVVEVALDKDEHPAPVPAYTPETEEEKNIFNGGALRNQIRKERRKQGI